MLEKSAVLAIATAIIFFIPIFMVVLL